MKITPQAFNAIDIEVESGRDGKIKTIYRIHDIDNGVITIGALDPQKDLHADVLVAGRNLMDEKPLGKYDDVRIKADYLP